MGDLRARPVLITGCSSGIGRATAERLGDNGWLVYATARRPDSIADLEAKGCRLLQLDVTDEKSIEAAVAEVEDEHGSVGALVNNAGYGLHGAVETTPMEEVRRQFETNFFGVVGVTQRVLPKMRAEKTGRIVNISSMGGRLAFPGGAFYHATKHALEAFSDVLRFELRPFGIDVVVVEPGLIKTNFDNVAVGSVNHPDGDDGAYSTFNQGVMQKISQAYRGTMGKAAATPAYVARTIERALSSRRPSTRYVTPFPTYALLGVRRVLPDRAFDAVLRTQYPEPDPGAPASP